MRIQCKRFKCQTGYVFLLLFLFLSLPPSLQRNTHTPTPPSLPSFPSSLPPSVIVSSTVTSPALQPATFLPFSKEHFKAGVLLLARQRKRELDLIFMT